MRRRLILSALIVALAAPALAAEDKKPADGDGMYVDLAQVGLPIVRDGRLVNFVFAQVRVNLRPGANPGALRAKEPFFRDALVRAGYRTPFVLPADSNRIDEAAVRRVMGVEAARIAGAGSIASIQVVNQQPKRYVPK